VDLPTLYGVVQTRADATCEELRRMYNRAVGRGQHVSRSAIARALRRAGYVLKKDSIESRKSAVAGRAGGA
jgi:transposase